MINIEKLDSLVKSEGWKEFKKVIEKKRYELSLKLIDNPKQDLEKEVARIKAFEECISIPENIVKKEIFKKKEQNALGELPDSL